MNTTKRARSGAIAAFAVVTSIVLALAIARANYRECREGGFTARYCALTHFVR